MLGVPASEFRFRSRGTHYSFALTDGDWFYFAGIWCPASRDWPESYAILTTQANPDVVSCHDRQMGVLRLDHRMVWLDMTFPEAELLQPLAGRFPCRHEARRYSGAGAFAF